MNEQPLTFDETEIMSTVLIAHGMDDDHDDHEGWDCRMEVYDAVERITTARETDANLALIRLRNRMIDAFVDEFEHDRIEPGAFDRLLRVAKADLEGPEAARNGAVSDSGAGNAELDVADDRRRRAVLFNDITYADIKTWLMLSDRQAMADYLWAQGWRRDVRPDDVNDRRLGMVRSLDKAWRNER